FCAVQSGGLTPRRGRNTTRRITRSRRAEAQCNALARDAGDVLALCADWNECRHRLPRDSRAAARHGASAPIARALTRNRLSARSDFQCRCFWRWILRPGKPRLVAVQEV